MKKLILKLDFGAFPVWIYNDDILEDNDLPEELKNNEELDKELVSIQTEYEKLFTNDVSEFKYNGFKTVEEKDYFMNKVKIVENELERNLKGKYKIVNNINI